MEYQSQVVILCLIQMFIICASFSLDLLSPVIHYGDSGTLFGFSVAVHREGSETRLLVGAPKAQSMEHEDVIQGGLLYQCPIVNSTDSCQTITIDSKGHTINNRRIQTANKSYQLFGSTVQSAGPDSYVMVCAPNYVKFFEISSPDEEHIPIGICYISSNIFTSPTTRRFLPCKDYSVFNSRMCQVGFSGLISETSFIVGAPGSHFWQGQLFLQSLQQDYRYSSLNTKSKSTRFDDSYQGYSIATGDLDGNGTMDYVTGSPKRYNLLGCVSSILYTYDTFIHTVQKVFVYSSVTITSFDEPMFEVIGYQFGAYFGHSVEVSDLNGDGLDDLIVGAPTYSDLTSTVPLYDIGRVYIYYQQDTGNLSWDPQVIQGLKGNGRFGFTIAALGDVDLDGVNDLAVSAPYENNDEGAVYIFNGQLRGLSSIPSQVLSPPKHGSRHFRGFGFALSGNFDVDENGYNDLLVGAPHSSSVVLYRTSPIIRLTLSIHFDVQGVLFHKQNLLLPDGSLVSGFNTTTCLQYEGTNVNDNAVFKCTIRADSLRTIKSRALFIHGDGMQREITEEIDVRRSQSYCMTYKSFLKRTTIDVFHPLVFSAKCSLSHGSGRGMDHGRIHSVLEHEEEIEVAQIPILTNCSSGICSPDLYLRVERNLKKGTSSEAITIGQHSIINVTVTIGNDGFDTHDAQLLVTLPQGIYYSDIVRRTVNHMVSCSVEDKTMTMVCDLENPFRGNGHSVTFDMLLTADNVDGATETIAIGFNVTSSDTESDNDGLNNSAIIRIPIAAEAEVVLYSDSKPSYQSVLPGIEEASYNKYKHEEEIGTEVTHIYAVQNLGPSDVSMAELTIYWPMASYYGYLLYLMNVTLSTGDTCHVDDELNPVKLLLHSEIPDAIDDSDQTTQRPNVNVSEESATEGFYVDIPTNLSSRRYSKRTAEVSSQRTYVDVKERYRDLSCMDGMEECYTITCKLRNLIGSGERNVITVQLRSRIWEDTFKRLPGKKWRFTSNAMLKVTNVPYRVQPISYSTAHASASIEITKLEFQQVPSKKPPLWIIVFSICGGILILTAILGVLVKVGFFTRRRNFKQLKEENENTPAAL